MFAAETQMQGVAVIASRCGGLKEILQDGETGFLVEPGSSEQLAERLHQLLSNRAEAIRLGTAGHTRAARYFSSETFAIRMEALYEAVIFDRDKLSNLRTGYDDRSPRKTILNHHEQELESSIPNTSKIYTVKNLRTSTKPSF
jgi:hypothetical protein